MQFNVFIASTILASASVAISTTVTGFAGADCTGIQGESFNNPSNECFTLGVGSTKSIRYTNVPNSIQFFVSGGPHDFCTGSPQLVLGGGSGCATAPPLLNWESVIVF